MKRIFILVSTLLASIFFIWLIVSNNSQYLYASYDSVSLTRVKKEVQPPSREDFERELDEFVLAEHSLVARRVVEPSKEGNVHFTYVTYGQGELSREFEQSSKEGKEQSDLLNSYLILSGTLTKEKLAEKLDQMGYRTLVDAGVTPLRIAILFFINPFSLISLAIFSLTFFSMVVISRIKDMRTAGIRLFAGQSLLSIIRDSILEDALWLALAGLLSFVMGAVAFFAQGLFYSFLLLAYGSGIMLYLFLLFGISLLLALLYVLSLSYKSLVPVLKGRLPLKRLMSLTLLCQLVAVFTVGLALETGLTTYQNLQSLEVAKVAWNDRAGLYRISFGMGNHDRDEGNTSKWYDFAQKAIEEGGAIYIDTNVSKFDPRTGLNEQGETLDTYSPTAKSLSVSPSYLEREKVQLASGILQRLQDLKRGEFGLLLPEHLKSQEKELTATYEAYMTKRYGRAGLEKDSPIDYEMKAIVSYIPDGQKQFIYNDGEERSSLHYLEDPILVVITPTATGQSMLSQYSWSFDAANSVLLKDYDKGIALMKETGIYEQISYFKERRSVYLTRYYQVQTEAITLLSGAVIGVASSLLLFYSVNLLYFEQFRREIMIKRISGLHFLETHGRYMLSQLASFTLGSLVFIWHSNNLLIGIATLLVFLLLACLTLYRQAQKETRLSMLVMKGK